MWYLVVVVGGGGVFQSLMLLLLLLDLGLSVCAQEFDYPSSKTPAPITNTPIPEKQNSTLVFFFLFFVFPKNFCFNMFHAQIMGVPRNSLFHVEMKKKKKGNLRSCNPCNSLSSPPKINLIFHLSFFLWFQAQIMGPLQRFLLMLKCKKGRNFEIVKPTFPFPQKQISILVFLMFPFTL